MNYQKSTCPLCGSYIEIPESTFTADPENRGRFNYWRCENCGLLTTIDETVNQFTGESHIEDPERNYYETREGDVFPLDHEF